MPAPHTTAGATSGAAGLLEAAPVEDGLTRGAGPAPAAPHAPAASGNASSMRRLGRDALVYGFAVLLNRVVSFVMLPVYTRFLTPADYGVLQLLEMTTDIAAILFLAGMNAGVERFYFKAESEDERARVVFSAFALEIALSLLATLTLVALSGPITRHALGGAASPQLVHLAAWNFSMAMMLSVPLLFVQIQQRAILYSLATLAKLVLQLSLNILFVVHLRYGAQGVLMSGLIANALVGGALVVRLVRQTGFRLSVPVLRDLRRFGLPYQVTTAGTFVLTFGDRYFLQASRTIAEVGIYGLAYQFGFLLTQVAAAPYLRAWNPQRFALAQRPREERDPMYARGFLFYNILLLSAATGMCVFIRPVIALMTTAPFQGAATLVPVIAAAYVIQSWGDVAKLGIDVSERTSYITYATWASVALVLAAYALLIPLWGAMGAALATVAGFALRTGLTWYWSQRAWPVEYQLARHVPLLAAATGVSVAAALLPRQGVVVSIATGAGLYTVYLVALWIGVLTPREREVLRAAARRPGSALTQLTRAEA